MSEDAPQEASKSSPADSKPSDAPATKIYLVSYPKVVFLYPTFLAAIVCGIYMAIAGKEAERADVHILALVFLAIFAINLVVLSFDFPRTTSLTLFFFFAAVAMGLWLLFFYKPDLLGSVSRILGSLRPMANATFYFLVAAFLGLIFFGVFVSVKFDYWEVRPNELLHHHGILSDLERFSAPNLRIDKEINDVFEYLLLRAGRLILHPSNERRAIVLENVFFINYKEREITRMLGALQVQLRTDGQG